MRAIVPIFLALSSLLAQGASSELSSIEAKVIELMKAEQVAGLGVALIRDGRVTFTKTYGLRNVEQKLPLDADTVMYGASLTKATFAYLVMQLVDEGKIDLDKPVAAYLPKPLPEYPRYRDLAGDARWQQLTMRILLSHTTGFANFRFVEEDRKLRFHHAPGERYGYSGEGLLLAQFVLEQGLKLDVGAQMQRRIFDRFGMKRSALTWREDFATNVAETYTQDHKLEPHRHWDEVGVAGSLDTTLEDWAKFLAAVVRGEGLSKNAKAEMIRRQVAIDSERQFPTLLPEKTDRWKAIGLGYGLGWGVFETPRGHAFFKEGHDEGTANYALCIEGTRDCVLLMSNSVRAENVFVPLVNELLGETNLPAEWEGFKPAAPRKPAASDR
ncbi:MAG: serine hydrolase domain-containing protein [Pseudomonadota bacterium]